MAGRTRTTILALAGAALALGLGVLAFRPVPVSVDLVEVTRGPMAVTVDVDGKTRIREIYVVAAPITGTTLRSPVRVGDLVIRGETVVAQVKPVVPSLLDARSRQMVLADIHAAEAALDAAESRLKQAQENLTLAQSQYDRAAALLDRGVATLSRVEESAQALAVRKAAREAAASERAMAEGALERARAGLIGPEGANGSGACCVDIAAPADGLVLSIVEVSERPVLAGEPLLSIGAPDDLEIVADPLSRDAVRMPPGAVAEVLRWGGDTPLTARLQRIDPSARTEVSALGIEEQRVEAIFGIDGKAAAAAGLGDGYEVLLRVELWRGADVVQVPLGALFRTGAEWAVFTAEGGRARLRTVGIGRRNAYVAEVTSGLRPGDVVIAHPGEAVADGVRVTPTLRE